MLVATARLEDVLETLIDYRGKTPTKTASGVRLITAKVIKDGFINDASFEYIAEEEYDAWMRRGLPRVGDVLLTTEAPLGEVARLSEERVALAQRVILLRANPKRMDQRFMFHAFKSPFVQAELQKRATGTTVLGIKQSELRQIRVPSPPLPVQRRIADVVSPYDDLIENNAKRIKILEKMARSLYREWFVEVKRLPAGWNSGILGDIVDEVRGTVDPKELPADTPYFGLEHLPRRSTTLYEWGVASEVQSTKFLVKRGDVLFGKIRPYFHKVGLAPVDAVCSSDAIVLRPKSDQVRALALACASSDDFVARATASSQGTKMPRANWNLMRKYRLPIPPSDLLARFNAVAGGAANMAAALGLKNRALIAARDLLLPRLISGDIELLA
jgi:type I restriction enzyme S subunit